MNNDQALAIPAVDYPESRALFWIARFGWLRSRELGALLWPNTTSAIGKKLTDEAKENTQRVMANRMIRTLRDQNWVLSRRLPKSAGISVVLTAAGARYLQRELNVHARPGDNWGRSQGGVWKAPSQWQHELLVTILLVRSIGLGCEVKTELEVRAENSGLTKYPDGLIKSRDFDEETKRYYDVVQWLEVESADKSGAKMLALVKALLRVSRHDAPVLSGWQANVPVVAYRSDLISPSGKSINHQRRIESAIQRHIGADLYLYFKPLEVLNGSFHVRNVEAKEVPIKPIDISDKESLINRAFFPVAHKTFIWPVLLPCHGQPRRNGARADRRAHPRRTGCCPSAWPQGRSQAQDDREQDRVSQEAAGQWRARQGCSQEPRRIRSYTVPLGASLGAALAYFKFRFLRRPLQERRSHQNCVG